jgi:murein DD-endopeptidase MepM/ murein hydrolase activator NlpD
MNVGKGLNAWMQGVFKSGPLGFAGGGEVDTKQFFEGEDYTNVIARSVEDSVSKEVNRTMVNLSKELSLKPVGREEMIQQNIQRGTEGTEPENLETAGGAVAASQLYKEIGANLEQWDIFRNSIALIESKGKYGIPGGSGMHYDGRYQMGEAAKKDGARVAGVSYPGHSSDPNAHVRVSFRNNPQLQETIFTGYTLANHRYLMRNPKYRSASVERKLQILGYAHNQGMGGAESWLTTGVVGADGFGTKGTKYTDLIARNFKAKKSGGQMQLAQGAVGVPSTSPGGVPSGNVSQKGLPPLPPTNTLPGKQHYGAPRRGGRRHAGVDFDAPDNGTFYSRIGGMVKYIGNEPGGYYKYVDIFNSQLGVTERIAEGDNILVRVGQNVSKGTPVARGTTTTGVFHYEIRRGSGTTYGFNGTVDPVKFLNSSSRSAFHGENFGIVQRDGFILKLHKGEMYKVVDKDTVDLLGFDLTKEIIDIENKSQLIAKTPSIIERLKTISGYTDYERPEPEIVYIPLGGEESTLVAGGGGGGSTIVASAGGDNYVNSSMEQTLAQIG